jgi:hypothetical protein
MAYTLLFVVFLDRLNIAWLDRVWLSRMNAAGYTAVLSTWLVAAWRRGEVMAPVPANLKRQWWPWAPAA